MADFPTSNLNDNLIAAGLNASNPTGTYTDLADAISKNQADQAAQEQALALAKQHVAQAQLQTQQATAADQTGVNPYLKGMMTREQAVEQLKLIAKAKGLSITDDDIQQWAQEQPEMISAEDVQAFADRFARSMARMGQPFVATKVDAEGDKRDENGDPLIAGQTYSALYDNKGDVQSYVRAGEEKPDTSARDNAKGALQTEHQWQALDKEINIAFRTRSGGLGSLSTAVFRAVRAINTLNANPDLTAQDLANVAQDVAGIFQGGAPSVVTAEDNDYRLTLLSLANWFRAQTGLMAKMGHLFGSGNSPLDPTRRKLLDVCTQLRDSAIENINKYMESEAAAYKGIIEADPDRWQQMQTQKLQFIESGVLIPVGAKTLLNITGNDEAVPAKNPQDTSATVPTSAAVKLPTSDEIDAEIARRKQGKK